MIFMFATGAITGGAALSDFSALKYLPPELWICFLLILLITFIPQITDNKFIATFIRFFVLLALPATIIYWIL